MRVCSDPRCNEFAYERGYCYEHWNRLRNAGAFSRDDRPSIIPVGWMPAAGPQPYSRELITQRSNAAVIDAARDARDAERFDVRLTPAGLVVRERAEVAA